MLTGNPIYSLDTGLGLPVNPVLGGIRAVYHEFQGPANGSVTAWLGIAKDLLLGAPLALLIGLPGIAAAGKERIGLGISVLLAFVLWYWSIANTSGGIAYTWRFLAPAWIVLSISAGAFGPALLRAIEGRRLYLLTVSSLALAICGGYSIVCSWSESFEPSKFSFARYQHAGRSARVLHGPIVDREDTGRIEPSVSWRADRRLQSGRGIATIYAVSSGDDLESRGSVCVQPAQEASIVRQQLIDKHIWLVAVTYLSLNNNYLIKFPFYAELFQNMKPIVAVPEAQSIVFLPKLSQPDFETVTPGK